MTDNQPFHCRLDERPSCVQQGYMVHDTPRNAVDSLVGVTPWKTGFDGETYDLKYTFLHEIGHVLGLDPAVSADTVMNFRYRESVSCLQQGDIAGISPGPPRAPMPAVVD